LQLQVQTLTNSVTALQNQIGTMQTQGQSAAQNTTPGADPPANQAG
jgi:hypothetical protein